MLFMIFMHGICFKRGTLVSLADTLFLALLECEQGLQQKICYRNKIYVFKNIKKILIAIFFYNIFFIIIDTRRICCSVERDYT